MKKFLFDEAGLQEFLQSLYALDDANLTRAVAALEADFSMWIMQQFELKDAQLEFFKKMRKPILSFLTHQCSFAIQNRLPIELEKGQSASGKAAGEEGDKLFEPKSNLQASTDANGEFKASGRLLIMVSYS